MMAIIFSLICAVEWASLFQGSVFKGRSGREVRPVVDRLLGLHHAFSICRAEKTRRIEFHAYLWQLTIT